MVLFTSGGKSAQRNSFWREDIFGLISIPDSRIKLWSTPIHTTFRILMA
jgi:hypothetical protein